MTKAHWRGLRLGRLAAIYLGLACAGVLMLGADPASWAQAPSKTKAPPKGSTAPLVVAPGQVPVPTDEVTKFINTYFEKVWADNKLQPSPIASDYEFIRRASLDIIGRIAKPAEIEAFLRDPPATRRAQLIDRLLNSEEYARHWANLWTVWLMTRTGDPIHHEQLNMWLEDHFAKGTSYKEIVEKLITATGANNENGAVNFILAHLGEPTPPAKRAEEGQFEMVPITSRITRLFVGYQTQCTQCHNHPFNPEWTQQHFWGVNAFLRQIDAPQGGSRAPENRRDMAGPRLTLSDNPNYNKDGIVYYEKRSGVVLPTKPTFLDGRRIPADSKMTRRQALAQFVTSHENFAPAYINRMWGSFFGRGLNENPTVDDFGEHNKVVHPELLDFLAKAWTGSGAYDPRTLIRWICNSKPYHLSCQANATNEKAEFEPFFSRMLLKSMSPEQLFESLMVATQLDQSRDQRRELRERWMRSLIVNFGDDEGNEVTFNGTVVQALLMINGRDLNSAVFSSSGTVANAMKKHGSNTRAIIDELFLAALNRRATNAEYNALVIGGPGQYAKLKMRVPDRDAAAPYQDLLWALLNCNEFILNH
ncbi:MAG: DUF1549 and DUF1553 domain-containing protein [Gemmataceae bacterium]|nr:DUF1549 and DUF1553 domain-containing protein [Gemmataceae bacterium]MDW8265661.1 DUF1549 domain-containing protein [Gemmataceae bacterium]